MISQSGVDSGVVRALKQSITLYNGDQSHDAQVDRLSR